MIETKEDELAKELKRERFEACMNCKKFIKCEDSGKYVECADFEENAEAWIIEKLENLFKKK